MGSQRRLVGTDHADYLEAFRNYSMHFEAFRDFILRHDRSASVSFVYGASAKEYYSYVKRNDLYINGKRVWCAQHLVLKSLLFFYI